MDKWPTKAGLELQWALPREPVCQTQKDCDDGNNASCVTDLASTGGATKRCFCVKPFVWNPISGMCERNRTYCGGQCEDSFHVPLITGAELENVQYGTLADHLHGSLSPLSWHHRLSVAHQTAVGLAYLHFSAMPPIYHRDVKSSNILLDENLNAKVSDFGLSRLATPDLSHISTCAQGTLGYLDPEYFRNFQLTDKSDVYSFGVDLLELLTAQKAINFSQAPDDINLRDYIQGLVEEKRIMEAVDPTIKSGATQVDLDSMEALGFLALSCLEERRQNRPSMKEVADEIEFIISLLSAGVDQSH